MNSDDLEDELEAACLSQPLAVTDARLRLVRAGTPLAALQGPFPVGWTTIEADAGLYQPCPGGRPAFIIPEPMNISADWANPDWRVIDLVAVIPSPLATFTRRGIAWCLGRGNVERAVYSGEPLTVHRTPFSWLRAERQGIAIIEPDELATRLSWCNAIIGQDLAHARELRDLLVPPEITIPQVLVPPQPEAAYV
ncbi:MAG: hypothetical protein AB7O49_10115 [Sphingomonadales bacterium]